MGKKTVNWLRYISCSATFLGTLGFQEAEGTIKPGGEAWQKSPAVWAFMYWVLTTQDQMM